MAGSTPIWRKEAAFSALRVVPVTTYPASTNSGASRLPTAPLAPARKIFLIMCLSPVIAGNWSCATKTRQPNRM
jgi:hypothetical protein